MATCSGAPAEDFAKFTGFLTTIGGLTVAYCGLKALYSIYNLLTTFVFSSTPNLKRYGEWAVVTGATDGIGKAYAQELARKGLNIVLISRTQEKLQDVAAELESLNSGIKTKVIAADFTKGWELREHLRKELQGLHIGILVNNVGMSYGFPEFYLDVPDLDSKLKDIIDCNIVSVLMMTQICLPGMVERRKGLVINISSGSGYRPTALLTVYSATKAFVDFFSEAMNKEYSRKGVNFQVVLPFFVATKMSKIRRANLLAPSPSDFVRSALATVGRVSRTPGYLPHHIQNAVAHSLPGWLVDRQTFKIMLDARRRAHKRLQEKKD